MQTYGLSTTHIFFFDGLRLLFDILSQFQIE